MGIYFYCYLNSEYLPTSPKINYLWNKRKFTYINTLMRPLGLTWGASQRIRIIMFYLFSVYLFISRISFFFIIKFGLLKNMVRLFTPETAPHRFYPYLTCRPDSSKRMGKFNLKTQHKIRARNELKALLDNFKMGDFEECPSSDTLITYAFFVLHLIYIPNFTLQT